MMNSEYMQEQLTKLVTKKLYDTGHKNTSSDFFSEQQQPSIESSHSENQHHMNSPPSTQKPQIQQTSLFAALESNKKARIAKALTADSEPTSTSSTSSSNAAGNRALIGSADIFDTTWMLQNADVNKGLSNAGQSTSCKPGDATNPNDQDFFHHFLLTKKLSQVQKNNENPTTGTISAAAEKGLGSFETNPIIANVLNLPGMLVPSNAASDSPENQAEGSPNLNSLASRKEKKRRKKYKPTLQEIQSQFDLPLIQAARKLNICETKLKRLCRSYGINRWPFRKRKKRQTDDSRKSSLGGKPAKRRKGNDNNDCTNNSNFSSDDDEEDDDFDAVEGVEDFMTSLDNQQSQENANIFASSSQQQQQQQSSSNAVNFFDQVTSEQLAQALMNVNVVNALNLQSTNGFDHQQSQQAQKGVPAPTNLFVTTSEAEQEQQRINEQQKELAKNFEMLFPQNMFLASLDEEKQVLLAKLAQGALCSTQNLNFNFNLEEAQSLLDIFNMCSQQQQNPTTSSAPEVQSSDKPQPKPNDNQSVQEQQQNPKILISSHNDELATTASSGDVIEFDNSNIQLKIPDPAISNNLMHSLTNSSISSNNSSNTSSKTSSPLACGLLPQPEFFVSSPNNNSSTAGGRASTSTAPFFLNDVNNYGMNDQLDDLNCFKEDGLLRPGMYIDTNVKHSLRQRKNQMLKNANKGVGELLNTNNSKDGASSSSSSLSVDHNQRVSSNSSPSSLVKFFLEGNASGRTPISNQPTPSNDNLFNFHSPFVSSTPFDSTSEMGSSLFNDHFQDGHGNGNGQNINNRKNSANHFDQIFFN